MLASVRGAYQSRASRNNERQWLYCDFAITGLKGDFDWDLKQLRWGFALLSGLRDDYSPRVRLLNWRSYEMRRNNFTSTTAYSLR